MGSASAMVVPKKETAKKQSAFYVINGLNEVGKVLSNKKLVDTLKTTISVSELILLSPLHVGSLLKGMYVDNTVLSTKNPHMSTGKYIRNMLIKVALPAVVVGGLIYGLTHPESTFSKTVAFGGTSLFGAWVQSWKLLFKLTGTTLNFAAKTADWSARHLNTMTSANYMPIVNPNSVGQTTTTMLVQ